MGLLQSLKNLLPRVDPDYEKGRRVGEEYAKRDAAKIDCGTSRRPSAADAALKARSFSKQLRAEGKSEAFINGFCYGYRHRYSEYLGVYCGA